jgi:hypothetical protein
LPWGPNYLPALLPQAVPAIARSGVPHAGESGRTLGTFVLKAEMVFSPRFFACGTSSTFLYGNGSHSNRVTVTPDRVLVRFPLNFLRRLESLPTRETGLLDGLCKRTPTKTIHYIPVAWASAADHVHVETLEPVPQYEIQYVELAHVLCVLFCHFSLESETACCP